MEIKSYNFNDRDPAREYLMAALIWLHNRLGRCHECHWRKAVWSYAPGHTECCEECVPRGCSCNSEPIDGNYENFDPSNWADRLDEKGRKVPCCEWWWQGGKDFEVVWTRDAT